MSLFELLVDLLFEGVCRGTGRLVLAVAGVFGLRRRDPAAQGDFLPIMVGAAFWIALFLGLAWFLA